MKIFESVRACPFCRQMGIEKESICTLFGKEVDDYMGHLLYGKTIQQAVPNLHPAVREYMRNTNNPDYEAYCSEHMKLMFGKTSPRIKDFTTSVMNVCETLDIDDEDNFIKSRSEYYQLQKELVQLQKMYEAKGENCYCRAVRIEDLPEGKEAYCQTEHLAIYKAA